MRRKRERGPQLPPDAGSTGPAGEAPADQPPPADEPSNKRPGLLDAIKESMREAALRRTSTKR